MNKHTTMCVECDQQCVMYSNDWHWCHMTDRCEWCGEWMMGGDTDVGGGVGDTPLCPDCAADYKAVQKDQRAAKKHGIPYPYWRAGVDPRDFA